MFSLHGPEFPQSPFVLEFPHDGTAWPDANAPATPLRERMADLGSFALWAKTEGATMLRASYARGWCDLNRAPDDLSPTQVTPELRPFCRPSSYAQQGIGLVWPRAAVTEPLQPLLTLEAHRARVEGYYWPYHRRLRGLLDTARVRYGASILLSCHTMPADRGREGIDLCLGDRHGESAHGFVIELLQKASASAGFRVARNQPYAGAEITRVFGEPRRQSHAVQLEFNQALFINASGRIDEVRMAAVQRRVALFWRELSGKFSETALAAE